LGRQEDPESYAKRLYSLTEYRATYYQDVIMHPRAFKDFSKHLDIDSNSHARRLRRESLQIEMETRIMRMTMSKPVMMRVMIGFCLPKLVAPLDDQRSGRLGVELSTLPSVSNVVVAATSKGTPSAPVRRIFDA
jgi:hypothetical protein